MVFKNQDLKPGIKLMVYWASLFPTHLYSCTVQIKRLKELGDFATQNPPHHWEDKYTKISVLSQANTPH